MPLEDKEKSYIYQYIIKILTHDFERVIMSKSQPKDVTDMKTQGPLEQTERRII